MSGVTILEQQHVFVTLLDFRDGALLHGVIPNLNICTKAGKLPAFHCGIDRGSQLVAL